MNWNYDLVSSEYYIPKNYGNKIYWNGFSNTKQLEILKQYYPIGQQCVLLKNPLQPIGSYKEEEYIISDYMLLGEMCHPKNSSYISYEDNLSEFFHMGFTFKILIIPLISIYPYNNPLGHKIDFPNRIRMNKQFLRKLTLENILI